MKHVRSKDKPSTQKVRSSQKSGSKSPEKLTLYDRLSHLTYRQACGLLGEEGAALLRRNYTFEELDVKKDVYLPRCQ